MQPSISSDYEAALAEWDALMAHPAPPGDDFRTLHLMACDRDIANGTLVIDETLNPFEDIDNKSKRE